MSLMEHERNIIPSLADNMTMLFLKKKKNLIAPKKTRKMIKRRTGRKHSSMNFRPPFLRCGKFSHICLPTQINKLEYSAC